MSRWAIPYLWSATIDGALDFWPDKPGIVRFSWRSRKMAEEFIGSLPLDRQSRFSAVPIPNTGIF